MLETDFLYPNDMIAQCEAARKLLAKENEDIEALERSILEFVNDEGLISRKVDGAKAHFYDYYLLLEELKKANAGDIVAFNTLQSEIEANVYEDLCGDVIIPVQIEAYNNYLSDQAKADQYLNWANNNILFITNMNLCLLFTSLSNHYRQRAKQWFDLSIEYKQKMLLYDTIEYKTAGLFPGNREDIYARIRAGLEEIGVAYQNATFNISIQSQWRPENVILPECYGEAIEAQQVEVYLNNLENSDYFKSLSEDKQFTIYSISSVLLDEGYEPEFVAGVLGNIMAENSVGYFENSNYKTNPYEEPNYLKLMDKKYNYQNLFSNRSICEVGLEKTIVLIGKIDGVNEQFGLGCVQWTGSRTKTLVEYYQAECGDDMILSRDECATAEGKLLIDELAGSHASAYTEWKANIVGLDSNEQVYQAAVCFHDEFVRSDHPETIPDRADFAQAFYCAMMGTY